MDRRKVCRYFERGSCKKQNCPFVHLRENRKICDFFQQGSCKKGAKCNFYHPPKENQEQKINRGNFKPSLQKRQLHHQKIEEHQQIITKEEEVEDNHKQKVEEREEQQAQYKKQSSMNELETQQYKKKQIDFLLGIGQDLSSGQEDEGQSVQVMEQPKRKPLNFSKIYPKKFPDYTKSAESKQKILENQKLYFQGVKFAELIAKIKNPIEVQYYQLIRKFQDSYSEIESAEQGEGKILGKCFTINLRPLLYQPEIGLHFEMVEDFIQLKIDARNYPTERAKFEVLNISIPEQYKSKFIAYLDRVHRNKSIQESLKVLMNNFQKIYEQSKSKLENEYYSQIELEEKIEKKIQEEKERKEKKRQRKEKKVKTQQNTARAENPDLEPIRFGQNEKINVGNMNYEIKLDSLLITNAEYVLAERFLLYIQCQCEKQLVHILEADRKQMKIGIKLRCKKCRVTIPIAIHRQVMQLRSQVIGRLGIENGRLKQVGGISWKIGCTCNAEIIKPRICLPGSRLNANCHECFRQMQISFMGLGFINPFFKQSQLVENDRQLPNKGACKHMKLSFRWIRYGCCGRRFSCDECHINQSVYPHEKIEGATMLCGFCSYEQPVSKECVHCKRDLVRGVDKSGHWEGGLGCRDKTLLSKKDAKKYAGLTKQNKQHKG